MTPSPQNATVGETVHFYCQHTTGDVVWRINDQRVDDLPDASTSSEGGLHVLKINNAPLEYDGARIQCRALFDDNLEPELTNPAVLLLQG